MGFRLARRARADLDDIWDYVFLDSGREATADRLIDSIAARFEILADWPRAGRRRDDLRAGYRSHAAGDYPIFYRIAPNDDVVIRQ